MAWKLQDVSIEQVTATHGTPTNIPRHNHAEYQFVLNSNSLSEVTYRGKRLTLTAGDLAIIHPGEVHSNEGKEESDQPSTTQMMYLPVTQFGIKNSPLFFPDMMVRNPVLARTFLGLHQSVRSRVPLLEQESHLQRFLKLLCSENAGYVPLIVDGYFLSQRFLQS
jgi:hypothetical protein